MDLRGIETFKTMIEAGSHFLKGSSFRCLFPLWERLCVSEKRRVFVTDNLSLEVESVMTWRIIHFLDIYFSDYLPKKTVLMIVIINQNLLNQIL